jgi:hypothetical protein
MNTPFLLSEKRFLTRFWAALEADPEVRDVYFRRFDPHFNPRCPASSRESISMALAFYGGFRTRRRLLEIVPVNRDDTILDIGPEMGTECFLLAEVYRKVLVAEPDGRTAAVLAALARHYVTEDGRNAGDVIEIKQAGIIPPGTATLTNGEGGSRGPVYYDASGARDILAVFGSRCVRRIYLNHLAVMVPREPKIKVLLAALDAICDDGGVITWCDSVSELTDLIAGCQPGSPGTRHPLPEIKACIASLLPGFNVTFFSNRRPHQLITVARRC